MAMNELNNGIEVQCDSCPRIARSERGFDVDDRERNVLKQEMMEYGWTFGPTMCFCPFCSK